MDMIQEKLESVEWTSVSAQLHANGYALVPALLDAEICDQISNQYDQPSLYRKKISMERYRFGLGEYKYFSYPLPLLIRQVRTFVYERLVFVANQWMQLLNIGQAYPDTLDQLHEACVKKGQDKPTVLILKYGPGGYNTMHQDIYGDLFFPFQLVIFLDEPGIDYTGGEFVLTQQVPRAQSKAIVLQPRKGDVLIFTTNFRPVKSSRGYYRANMKHGVSVLHSGQRRTLGIIFHDATS
ncbi:2OG-Fe(II) oxygenase [Sediminibacterium ginsengisoli]|uniref:Fe2OG dioxygenase domain-containing protein n=1 Tax=Sediminibacterium ginsengisoli TaxID=413434 RepID=A0A1T4K8Z0_9BACT|nr:2OG-Fe(II) oxygenase [Sediminibacterium ginsengisoli]SJZ38912.1 hypothetical protein SAMN04488132_101541 [Sediminibacterium ginsengisoli]